MKLLGIEIPYEDGKEIGSEPVKVWRGPEYGADDSSIVKAMELLAAAGVPEDQIVCSVCPGEQPVPEALVKLLEESYGRWPGRESPETWCSMPVGSRIGYEDYLWFDPVNRVVVHDNQITGYWIPATEI